MSNLIVTIISIALIAVAAIMGLYYGGQAYQNAQINAVANAIMNEAQQILYAERLWSTNNNQPDISGMGTTGTSGTGMSALVNGKELAEWPSLGGTMGVSSSLTKPGPQPYYNISTAGTVSTGTYDNGCYSINGYFGDFVRFILSYNNGNYVVYSFGINVPYTAPCQTTAGSFAASTTDVSEINHPIVKIAKAINAAMNQTAANANLTYMPYIGLPASPIGGTSLLAPAAYDSSNYYGSVSGHSRVIIDANGTLLTNYCYLVGSSGSIIDCVFGPS